MAELPAYRIEVGRRGATHVHVSAYVRDTDEIAHMLLLPIGQAAEVARLMAALAPPSGEVVATQAQDTYCVIESSDDVQVLQAPVGLVAVTFGGVAVLLPERTLAEVHAKVAMLLSTRGQWPEGAMAFRYRSTDAGKIELELYSIGDPESGAGITLSAEEMRSLATELIEFANELDARRG